MTPDHLFPELLAKPPVAGPAAKPMDQTPSALGLIPLPQTPGLTHRATDQSGGFHHRQLLSLHPAKYLQPIPFPQ